MSNLQIKTLFSLLFMVFIGGCEGGVSGTGLGNSASVDDVPMPSESDLIPMAVARNSEEQPDVDSDHLFDSGLNSYNGSSRSYVCEFLEDHRKISPTYWLNNDGTGEYWNGRPEGAGSEGSSFTFEKSGNKDLLLRLDSTGNQYLLKLSVTSENDKLGVRSDAHDPSSGYCHVDGE